MVHETLSIGEECSSSVSQTFVPRCVWIETMPNAKRHERYSWWIYDLKQPSLWNSMARPFVHNPDSVGGQLAYMASFKSDPPFWNFGPRTSSSLDSKHHQPSITKNIFLKSLSKHSQKQLTSPKTTSNHPHIKKKKKHTSNSLQDRSSFLLPQRAPKARPVPARYFRAFWPRFALVGEDVGGCGAVIEELVVLRSAVRARPAPHPVALKAAKHFAHKARSKQWLFRQVKIAKSTWHFWIVFGVFES